jgi:antitoxin (DNA-binding transcriptional repressor) of toxin-antitoxin stability system
MAVRIGQNHGGVMSGVHKEEPVPSSSLDALPVVEVKAGVFKDICLSLLDEVKQREFKVIVTEHGAPVARVVPESGNLPSAHGFLSGTVLDHGDLVSPDLEAWGDLG